MQGTRCNHCNRNLPIYLMRKGRRQCLKCRRSYNKEYQKEYRNTVESREYQKRYHQRYTRTHDEKYHREYRQNNKARVKVSQQNYEARKRSLPHTLTVEQWEYALNYFDGCCAVCGRQLNDMFGEFTVSIDHWIPLTCGNNDSPGTVATNIVPLGHGKRGCNNSKHATLPDEWLTREFGKRKAKKMAARIQAYFDSLE